MESSKVRTAAGGDTGGLLSGWVVGPLCIIRHLWAQRILIQQFTRRFIEQRHKGSFLGAVWSVLNPFLLMCLYAFVFGVIFNGRYGSGPEETALDYAVGVFLSLTLFQLIAEVLGVSISLIVANGNLVKKVRMPVEVLPIASVGAALHTFGISLLLVLGAVLVFHGLPGPEALLLPLLVVPLVLLSLGISWFFAAMGVFIRDIGQLIQFLSLTLMYSSAIFYSTTMIPGKFWAVLQFNPLIHVVEQSRRILLWGKPLEWGPWLYATAFSALACYGGYLFFRKLKRGFADVL